MMFVINGKTRCEGCYTFAVPSTLTRGPYEPCPKCAERIEKEAQRLMDFDATNNR